MKKKSGGFHLSNFNDGMLLTKNIRYQNMESVLICKSKNFKQEKEQKKFMPTVISNAKISANISSFYSKYCALKKRPSESVEEFSARASFQTATKEAINYEGKNLAAKKVRNYLEPKLVLFLNNGDFSTSAVIDLMEIIRKEFHNVGIMDWTYGNSQKWINIAIKYYFIQKILALKYTTLTDISRFISGYKYELCPIDRIMIEKHFRPELGIDFYKYSRGISWSNCDDLTVFTEFWADLKSELKVNNPLYLPLIFEIASW